MNVQITYENHTVLVDMPESLLRELCIKRITGYERAVSGEIYHSVNIAGRVFNNTEQDTPVDNMFYDKASYYTDKKLAQDNARADTLIRKLRRYAALHGGIPSVEDWKDKTTSKWCIIYEYPLQSLNATEWVSTRTPGAIYFLSEKDCRDAQKIFTDELLWYSIEYEGQSRFKVEEAPNECV